MAAHRVSDVTLRSSLPSVSVIIPTRGRSSLGEAVASALSQLEVNVEVIVCVDGVSGSVPNLDELPAQVRLVYTERESNANVARNLGVHCARFDLVALLDDDDIWLPSKLAQQLATLASSANEHVLIATLVQTFGTSRPRIWPSPKSELSADSPLGARKAIERSYFRRSSIVPRTNYLQTSTWLTSRATLLAYPFDETLQIHQDIDWILRATRDLSLDIRLTQQVLVLYRINSSSTSRSTLWRESMKFFVSRASLPARERGDALLVITLPIALRSKSIKAVLDVVRAAMHDGSPGLPALLVGGLNILLGCAYLTKWLDVLRSGPTRQCRGR